MHAQSALKEFLNTYSLKPSNVNRQAIVDFYIQEFKERESIQKVLLVFFEDNWVNADSQKKWYDFFEFDISFWEKIFAIDEKKYAEEALKKYENKEIDDHIFSKMASIIAQSSLSESVISSFSVWYQVFNKKPELQKILLEAYSDYAVKKQKEKESLGLFKKRLFIKETIKKLEICVPVKMINSVGDALSEKEIQPLIYTTAYHEHMNFRIECFNSVSKYNKPEGCHDIEMRFDGDDPVFTLKIYKDVSLEKLRSDFLKIITEKTETNHVLIKNEIYQISLDSVNATPFLDFNDEQE